MNTGRLERLGAWFNALFAAGTEEEGGLGTPSVARLFDRSPELMDAADQVAAEQRGRVLIVAQRADHCRWLLAQLRRQPAVPGFRHLAREGLFTLACLPGPECSPPKAEDSEDENMYGWGSREDKFDLLADQLSDADLALFLIAAKFDGEGDGESSAQPHSVTCDTRSFARLRAAAVPVLPVLLQDARRANGSEQADALRRLLGVQPVLLTAPDENWLAEPDGAAEGAQQQELLALIERMLSVRPRLSIPLAQEAPFCRSLIAGRVIRTGAWITALVGMEPIPVIDLPLHVALQWKVILQVAAIYGRPGLDVRSSEMAGAVGAGVLLRLLTQQLLKLLPVVGWMLSGLLSGLSTLLIGHAFLRLYEHDRMVDLRAAAGALEQGARRRLAAMRGACRQLHFGQRFGQCFGQYFSRRFDRRFGRRFGRGLGQGEEGDSHA